MGQIIGYARVSTTDQDLSGQRAQLVAAGAVRVYEDKMSGARSDRPGLAQALDYAREGDTLAVVRLDRLGRSTIELCTLAAQLADRKINFLSIADGIDTGTAVGRFSFHIFAAVAQLERHMISERTRAGLAAVRASGKRIGRPAIETAKLNAAMTLVEAGTSVAEAARLTGLGRTTVYREISRRAQGQVGDGAEAEGEASAA